MFSAKVTAPVNEDVSEIEFPNALTPFVVKFTVSAKTTPVPLEPVSSILELPIV